MSVDENGAEAFAAMSGGFGDGVKAGAEIEAIDFESKESGEAGEELGDAAAWGLVFDGDADGVTIVLDEEDDGVAMEAGEIDGFPEFTFTGGAVAGGDEG